MTSGLVCLFQRFESARRHVNDGRELGPPRHVRQWADQGFATVIDFVPAKLELPPTEVTVNVTEAVCLRSPDLLTVQVVGEQFPEPDAPLLHAPETVVATGEPLLVTVIVTFAVHLDPLFTLDPLRETVTIGGAETVTFLEVVPEAPSSSETVSVTEYVPPAAYVCEGLTPPPEVLSPKLQA
jgi:hypothetical protein